MHAEFAVEHRERGGVHMHVLAARCDLETGKSLNIAPPGWRKTLGRLRDGFNHEHGRSRPDGPARVRADEPGDRAYIDAANLQAGLAVEPDPRELIRDYLGAARRARPRTQRADVVAALKDAGQPVLAGGEDVPDGSEAIGAERQRAGAGRLEAAASVTPPQLHDPQTAAIALLGVGAALEDPGDEPRGRRSRLFGPADEPRRGPTALSRGFLGRAGTTTAP